MKKAILMITMVAAMLLQFSMYIGCLPSKPLSEIGINKSVDELMIVGIDAEIAETFELLNDNPKLRIYKNSKMKVFIFQKVSSSDKYILINSY